jgi:hypothetical protein
MSVSDLILPADTEAHLEQIRETDIVVGIPSYNNADTIGHVVHAVTTGLGKYFPGRRAVLVNSDGGSTDGTPDVVASATIDLGAMLVSETQSPLKKIVTPYLGIPGKGSAFRTVFEVARRLGAKACAVVDSDLRSITPEWMDLLLRPVLSGEYDYVAPYYLRHKYDGTITNSIVYPLTRTLYGAKIRQPIGGEFGFSGDLANRYLQKQVWQSEVAKFGIDIWMTTEAIASGARVCQSFLGAKIHNPKDPTQDLSGMLVEVVGALFALMEEHESIWSKPTGSIPVPIIGSQFAVELEPVKVNVESMVNTFHQGVVDLKEIWERIFSPPVMEALLNLQGLPAKVFRVSDELWAKVVFDAAVAFHHKIIVQEHLLKALTPLYLGRTASFVLETQGLTSQEAEERIELLCEAFAKEKSYLLERWALS